MKFLQFNLNTLITALALAGIVWVAKSTQTLAVEMAEVKVINQVKIEQLTHLSIQVENLQKQMNEMQVELAKKQNRQ